MRILRMLLIAFFIVLATHPLYGSLGEEFEQIGSQVKVQLTETATNLFTISCELTRWAPEDREIEGEVYQVFPFIGEAVAGPDGYPELPAIVRFVLMPPQSGAELRIKERSTRILSPINPLPFSNPLASADQYGSQDPSSPTDRNLRRVDYSSLGEGFWPPEPVKLGEPAIMRNYRILPIVFYPLRFNPQNRQLEVTDWIEVELDFNSSQHRINLLSDGEQVTSSPILTQLISQTILNPPSPERDPARLGGSVVYVVGQGQSWDEVVNELQPLIEWRRRQGWKTVILRVNNPSTPGNVVQALQQAYRNWSDPPEYIVLVGDTDGNYPIGFFDMRRGAAYPYESDHPFTQLAGDDLLPEAVVGRIIYDNPNRLRGIVNKIVQYESDPYVGQGNEVGWQKRAALAAGDSRSGITSIDILRWTKKLLVERWDYQQVNERYWSPNEPQPNCRDFIINNINSGISFLIYRGWTFVSGYQFADVDNQRNGRMLPFTILATCNTGDYGEHVSSPYYYTERFIYHPTGGGIGSVGAAGATHTAYNNIYTTGLLKAVLLDSIAYQGWSHWAGKWQLYIHYAGRGDHNHPENNQMEAWLTEFYIFNLMGDPTTQLYITTPHNLIVRAPQNIRRGETHIEVEVLYDREEDVPASGLNVCLYKPSPQGNDPHRFQIFKTTDQNGRVSFDLTPDWTTSGVVKLTVWGLNVRPFLRDWEITQPNAFIAASSVTYMEDEDNDETANPSERLRIGVSFVNRGQERPQGEMGITLTPLHPEAEVIEGEAYFESAPEPGDSVEANFIVRVGGGFPNGEKIPFLARVSVGELSWNSSISIPVVGPKFGKPVIRWVREHLRPASAASFYLTITNIGGKSSPELRGTLFSLTHTISVPISEAIFPPAGPSDTTRSRDTLRLSAHPFHLGGQTAHLGLALEAQNGFRDTVWFSFPVDTARPGSPFGPDKYGYICFDDTDTSWFAAPTFRWIEIDPRLGGDGTNTQIRDAQDGQDASVLVELPFNFQYYGQNFRHITINSNGWIAVGDWQNIVAPRNRHIPGPENPGGMIAPYWADLFFNPNQGGVYTKYDEENHRFIVEWSRVRRLSPLGNNDSLLSFQVILHDPRYYPSFTGDGDIIFQYLRIYPNRNAYDWDTPFFSVGIASPDLSTGLEYAYWNSYAYGAAPIRNNRAIKFTTLVEFVTGHARGRVLDAWTGMPIEGVLVSTTYGFYGITDENGEYFIPDMLVDSSYTFTASKAFYNDSTLTGIAIAEGETTWVEFALLHPEFHISHQSLNYMMLPDSSTETAVSLANLGNGTLWFTTRYDYLPEEVLGVGSINRLLRSSPDYPLRRDDKDDLWDPLLIFDASDIGQGERDNSIQAIAFWRGYWYVAGGYNRNDTLNYFYRFTRSGEYEDRFPQPLRNRLGFRDMEVWRDYLWCTALDTNLYKVDPTDGQLVWQWRIPIRNFTPRAITIDPENEIFYLANVTGDIWSCRLEGENDSALVPVRSFPQRDPRDGAQLRTRGLAWFPEDPDGFKLYIFANNEPVANPDRPDISLLKMNVETGQIRFLTDFGGQIGASYQPLGMTISAKWNNLVWVLAGVFDSQDQDRVGIFELAPNASWLSFEPRSDTLFAGEEKNILFTINSSTLDTGKFGVTIEFLHNAVPGSFRLPVELEVVLELPPPPPPDTDTVVVRSDEWLRKQFGLAQNRPNPFNNLTRIAFGLEREGRVKLTVWDLQGREVARLVDEHRPAGKYEVVWNAAHLPAGIYIMKLESSGRVATRKMALIK